MEKNVNVTDRKSETVSAQSGKPTEQIAKPAETGKPTTETAVADAPLIDLAEAMGILSTSKSRSSNGAKIRPNIGYTLVAEKLPSLRGTSVPEQEQVMVKILLNALTKAKPVISEPELNKLVVAAFASGALKTKQDAWHIFRYYRTDLVKRGVLKVVELAAPKTEPTALAS